MSSDESNCDHNIMVGQRSNNTHEYTKTTKNQIK